MREILQSFQVEQADRIPGDLMFLQVHGSQSYNLSLPGSSDHDFLGVFVRPTHEILRVNPPTDHVGSGEGQKPDFQLHEVGKFASLLAKGNPTVIEMLFAHEDMYVTQDPWKLEWEDLVERRDMFLNQRTLKQYLGYAQGQWRRFLNGQPLHTSGSSYNTKWAYHVIRLLMDAKDIAMGEAPTVFKTGPRRELLMEIRNGVWSPQGVESIMTRQIDEIEARKPWSIPEEPCMESINSWLFNVRRIAL